MSDVKDLIEELQAMQRKADNRMRVHEVLRDQEAREWLEFLLTVVMLFGKLRPVSSEDIKSARKSANMVIGEFDNAKAGAK